jgi:sialic acid synthase SpsE
MNLLTIKHLSDSFGLPVGLSDHSMGNAIAVAAVALGARIVEKHLTLSRSEPGPDSPFSMEPDEFRDMVDAIRKIEKAMGRISYDITEKQKGSKLFRRSLFVVRDMKAGDEFSEENVRSIRPGYGLHTRHLPEVIGLKASRDLKKGTPLSWDLIS